jgi:hypothetical protein
MNELNDILIKMLLNIIYEYLDNMKNSEFFTKLENNVFLLSIGFRMMVHIFQLNYIHSKNINDVYFNCQKAYYYYLEYLEQMYSTNMCQELNHLDALLFVYSKTLVKYDNNSVNVCHKPQNKFVLPKTTNLHEKNIFIKKMSKITKLLNTLFWWENSSIKTFPDKSLFFEILMKHCNNETDELQIVLEEKQKIKVSYDDYILFLQQLPDS